jgi:hypothetical protein
MARGKHGQCGRMKDLTFRARAPLRVPIRWPCRELGRRWPYAGDLCFALASQHRSDGMQGVFGQDGQQPVAALFKCIRELRQDAFPVRLGVRAIIYLAYQ